MNRGYTLTEVLIAVAIVLALTIAVADLTGNFLSISRASSSRLNAELDGRRAMRAITRELRAASELLATSTSSITFNADTDLDGTYETVSIFRDIDNTLRRERLGVITDLARGLSSTTPLFTQNGRYIEVRFAIEGKEHSSGVTLRNIER